MDLSSLSSDEIDPPLDILDIGDGSHAAIRSQVDELYERFSKLGPIITQKFSELKTVKEENRDLRSLIRQERSKIETSTKHLEDLLRESEAKRKRGREINRSLLSKLRSLSDSSDRLKQSLQDSLDINEKLQAEVRRLSEQVEYLTSENKSLKGRISMSGPFSQ